MVKPPQPETLEIINLTENKVSISWSPIPLISPTLESFLVSLRNVDTGIVFLPQLTLQGNQFGITIDQLKPSTNYKFVIVTRNSDGISPEKSLFFTTLAVTSTKIDTMFVFTSSFGKLSSFACIAASTESSVWGFKAVSVPTLMKNLESAGLAVIMAKSVSLKIKFNTEAS